MASILGAAAKNVQGSQASRADPFGVASGRGAIGASQPSKGGPFDVGASVGGAVGGAGVRGPYGSGTTSPGYTDASSGVQLGHRTSDDDPLASRARPDQTGEERVLEERKDYLYGGREGAAQEAAQTAVNTGRQYGDLFSGAAGRAVATGTAYGTANANQAAGDRALGMDVGNRATDRFYNQGAGDLAMTAAQRAASAGAIGSASVNNTADQLKMLGNVRGPSVAQAQLDASTAAGMRQQIALARSGRGLAGGGAMLRNAEANQALMQGTANANAATLRAQEDNAFRQRQLAAYQAAGGLEGAGTSLALQGNQAAGQLALGAGQYSTGALSAGESQADAGRLGLLGLGAQQLGTAGQTALAGQALSNQALGQGSQSELAGQALGNNVNQSALQGTMGYEGNITNWRGQDAGIQQAGMQRDIAQAQIDQQNNAAMWGMIGTGIGTLASAAPLLSDASVKDVGGAGGDSATDMLRGLDSPDPYGGLGDVSRGIDTSNPYATADYGSGPSPGGYADTPGASDAYAKSMKQAGDYQKKQDASLQQQRAQGGRMTNEQGKDFVKQAAMYLGPKIAGLFSDRTEKTDIRPVGRQLGSSRALGSELDAIRAPTYAPPTASYPELTQPDQHALDLAAVRETDPYWYRYKQPEKYGEGQRFGIMAQDLAKSPVGRTAVVKMPNGKLAVDTPQLTTINTGALSEQQKQLDSQQAQNAGRDAALAELDARTNDILKKLRGDGRPAVGAR